MAKFIKLTSASLAPTIVFVDKITAIAVSDILGTEVFAGSVHYVTETPDEILALIKEAG